MFIYLRNISTTFNDPSKDMTQWMQLKVFAVHVGCSSCVSWVRFELLLCTRKRSRSPVGELPSTMWAQSVGRLALGGEDYGPGFVLCLWLFGEALSERPGEDKTPLAGSQRVLIRAGRRPVSSCSPSCWCGRRAALRFPWEIGVHAVKGEEMKTFFLSPSHYFAASLPGQLWWLRDFQGFNNFS